MGVLDKGSELGSGFCEQLVEQRAKNVGLPESSLVEPNLA